MGVFFDYDQIFENLREGLDQDFWDFLVDSFSLSREERLVLLLPLALESGKLSLAGAPWATPRMVAQLADLSYPQLRSLFHPRGKLSLFRLIRPLEAFEEQPLLDRPYTLPEALLDRLTGLPPVLSQIREIKPAPDDLLLPQTAEVVSLVREAKESGRPLFLELVGPEETGRLLLEEVLAQLGLGAWEVSLEAVSPDELGEILREALFEGRVVILTKAKQEEKIQELLSALGFLVFFLVPQPLGLASRSLFLKPPSKGYLKALFKLFGQDLSPLFPLSRGELASLSQGSRSLTLRLSEKIKEKARGLALVREPKRTLADLVLPEETKKWLRVLLARLQRRHQVLEDWGLRQLAYPRLGTNVLFSGPPGTGKTLAAEALAGALGLPLVLVDLAAVTSKWVGETEKNLRHIFEELVCPETVVVFDEAEALFGRRTEARQAQDRYANLETSYLLQRMDDHQGLVILTTNYEPALDEAFLRRLDLVVRFPFPGEEEREELWRRFLAEIPLTRGVSAGEWAQKHALSGAQIRNVVLNAAYLAGEKGVGRKEIEEALCLEFAKMGAMPKEK